MQPSPYDPVPDLRPKGGGTKVLGWVLVVLCWFSIPMCGASHGDGAQQAGLALWVVGVVGVIVVLVRAQSATAVIQACLSVVGLGLGVLAGLKNLDFHQGRPLFARRRLVRAARARRPASAERAETAAGLWVRSADMEWVSVAAFSQLSLDLMSLGAPQPLVRACHSAALEEIDHARLCFALAASLHPSAAGAHEAPLPDLHAVRRGLRPGEA